LRITLLLVWLTMPSVTTSFAACVAPNYVVGRIWEDTKSEFTATISMPLAAFGPARIACLGAALKQRYQSRKTIRILMFSSVEAARRYIGDFDIGDTGPLPKGSPTIRSASDLAKDLHGVYLYEATPRSEHVWIKPFGFSVDQPEDTRIDLPVSGAPHCRLELLGRCIVAFDYPTYPGSYGEKTTGTVTVTAVATKDGRLTAVQEETSSIRPASRKDAFVNATVKNLSTARLEPSSREETLRITYSYNLDASLQPGEVSVRFELPNTISVRFKPLE
jgi:hypothetical protein